ncbi:esterase-like activity of phytase family protein [Marinomonas sp. 15G1-11]|uniref:Esterase-like activity of phytase family protein n=1 Tax=Marinomonas phaeophyticola TaxID=3004091 RepID=A0ABT4JY42_9GAMM|nr:esterase-like activity of phytase family protein [Marinomonas sp. 15G1-11]MCZ2723193.1 esterase-like activity of phytase family protein [Marinomonas sp. 15G1-11]
MKQMLSKKHIALLISAISVSTFAQADYFQRISSWSTANNLPSDAKKDQETSAEIITASKDGLTVIYTDSPLGGLGFINITDENNPKAAGFISLGGEPTSVSMTQTHAITGVNTSVSYTVPSGYLAAVNLADQTVTSRCDLGGQPDSVAVSPDMSFVATAIENERDEDLNDGALPQYPAGSLIITPVKDGELACNNQKIINLTGLSEIAPSDPEPEFVAINELNEIVVTLQENNHIAIIDGNTGKTLNHFSAGSVDLYNVDLKEERALTFDGVQLNRKREPDSVKWIDNDRFVTANEGDFEGGSRSFTIFHKDGRIMYESGLDFEFRVAMAGHYPEKRSGNKGVEPEGLEVATFGEDTYIFVLAERSSIIGVYKDTGGEPEFIQLLPSGLSPESAIAIPERNLIVSANETDLIKDGGVRAHVMLYKLADQASLYPQIESMMQDNRPIGWGALSGLVADDKKEGIFYAVNDSFYSSQPQIFTIDANQTPARIIKATAVTRHGMPAQKLDQEGITLDGKGGFWIASEGRTDKLTPHALYNVNSKGEIKQEVSFPGELLAVEKRFGAEGITRIGDTLWIAIQRQWKDDADNRVKLVSYNTKTKEWGAVAYPTEASNKGWIGLSEITAYGDSVYVVERDNQIGSAAKIKRLYKIAKSEMVPAKLGGQLPLVKKQMVRDFIPDLASLNGFITDKLEGFAIDTKGQAYAMTDNDGVDDSSGETMFFKAGNY